MLLSLEYFLVARLLAAGSRLQDERDIELLVLRHQVKVMQRQVKRPRLRRLDRLLLAAASRAMPRGLWPSFVLRPETLLRWHRELVRKKWAYKRRGRPGRPPRRGSRSTIHSRSPRAILVDQPPDDTATSDIGDACDLGDSSDRVRRLKIDPPMRPVRVVVRREAAQEAVKMPRSEHECAVGHLCPDRPDQALGEGVSVRGRDGGLDDVHTFGVEHLVEGAGELGVAVADQEVPSGFPPLYRGSVPAG